MLNFEQKTHLNEIFARMEVAAGRSGRKLADLTLVAVTKTVPLERVLPFLEAGIQHIGENRVQEGESKWGVGRGELGVTTHLIGPLQSNKAKKAVSLFDMIQTLDRWDLAQDLDRHAAAVGKVQDCLIQIKISDEPAKSGLDPAALPGFLQSLRSLTHVRVRGLMGIPPLSATGDAARPYFQKLRQLSDQSKLEILSMGMSSDFETAIEEGATMVRIGSALFGKRI